MTSENNESVEAVARAGSLLAHVQKMQSACANYIEPTTYIARHPIDSGIGLCKWNTEFPMPEPTHGPEAVASITARRDQAFINDMIYMLDGPEQRAAFAATPREPSSNDWWKPEPGVVRSTKAGLAPTNQGLIMNNESVEAVALEPCPFCGGEAKFEHSYHEDDNRYPRDFWHVRIECQGCCLVNPDWNAYGNQEQKVANFHVKQAAEAHAAGIWNTRSTPREPSSRPEAVNRLSRVGAAQSGDGRMFTVQDAEAICAYIATLEATQPSSNAHTDLISHLRATAEALSRNYVTQEARLMIKAADALQALTAKPSHTDLIAAVQAIIANKSSTYRARNGRQMGIEADDGEMCWITHSDDMFALEAALQALHVTERHQFKGDESELRMRFNEAIAGGPNMNGDSGAIIHTDGHASDLERAIECIARLRQALHVTASEREVRLEAALRQIEALGSDGEHSGDRHARCRDIARTALTEDKGE